MGWQGIPFLMKGDEVFYHAEIILNKLPKIVLEIPEKGGGLEAFLTALVAGVIPAYVAYRAMKSNTQLVTQQQIQQGEIADKTIKAQVVAASMQTWINELRDLLSQYAADNRVCLKRHWDYYLTDTLFRQYQMTEENIRNEVFLEERRNAISKLDDAYQAREEILSRIHYVKNRVLLMLNHDEPECVALITMMKSIEAKPGELKDDDFDKFKVVSARLWVELDAFIAASQKYLKREWETIKASL
ncbi:hypothetical protein I4P06_03330 [Enterobacter asburiae]|uniref:hypothetical protein n=1 Tax=Enterobacter asburiae TaxID=61645 RepID=UPI0018C2718C|nr:hypothetical protein [Enterobacter asburiae]MBG0637042.1 hypothetical protein [Enterobacter asburiae]